jgi:hypothetical protein
MNLFHKQFWAAAALLLLPCCCCPAAVALLLLLLLSGVSDISAIATYAARTLLL